MPVYKVRFTHLVEEELIAVVTCGDEEEAITAAEEHFDRPEIGWDWQYSGQLEDSLDRRAVQLSKGDALKARIGIAVLGLNKSTPKDTTFDIREIRGQPNDLVLSISRMATADSTGFAPIGASVTMPADAITDSAFLAGAARVLGDCLREEARRRGVSLK